MFRALALVLCLLPLLAVADEATIRRILDGKLAGARIEGIQPAPMPGLYEVRYRAAEGFGIIYTDANASYIFHGKIYETRSDRDLTNERLRKLNAIKFESLPLTQAVKIQRGNGTRVMAMFSDPYCPYCKQFEKTLQQVDDITVYVFMYPIIRPELAEHSKAVWCSSDRSRAWLDLALLGKPSGVNAGCDTPLEKNRELGRALGINSTPTVILPNGERVSGVVQATDLREMLDDAMVQAKAR